MAGDDLITRAEPRNKRGTTMKGRAEGRPPRILIRSVYFAQVCWSNLRPQGKMKMEGTLKILRSTVPIGAYGRQLTSTEIRDIRAAGYHVSNSAIVQQNRAAHLGIVYNPTNGGYTNSGILVETK